MTAVRWTVRDFAVYTLLPVGEHVDNELLTVRDHLAVVRRRWVWPVLFMVLGGVTAYGLTWLQPRMFTAEASLLLNPAQRSTSATVMEPDEVATQADVVMSTAVADRVIQDLGLNRDPTGLLEDVQVSVMDGTRVVEIAVTASTAERAAEVANAFGDNYIDYRAEEQLAANQRFTGVLQEQLTEVRREIDSTEQEMERAASEERRQRFADRLQALDARAAEINGQIAAASVGDAPIVGGQVIRRAEPPTSPAQPRPVRAAALGAGIGLLLGLIVAYLRDRADDEIRSEDQLVDLVGDTQVLGRIPRSPASDRPVFLIEPHSAASEAYRSLAANVRFLMAASTAPGAFVVGVTSAKATEGKSTVASNLALAIAATGRRVLLVDGDLRRPALEDRFGLPGGRGLAHVLAGDADLTQAITDVGVDHLSLVTAGSVAPNPAELLGSPAARAAWTQARGVADVVIIDLPPMMFADVLEVSSSLNLLMPVVRRDVTSVSALRDALRQAKSLGVQRLGVVWLGAPVDTEAYDRYRTDR